MSSNNIVTYIEIYTHDKEIILIKDSSKNHTFKCGF